MQKTAIQQCLEEYSKIRANALQSYMLAKSYEEKEEWSEMLRGIDMGLNIMTKHLPTEQEQIEQAYNQGHHDGNTWAKSKEIKTFTSAQEYYNETYKTEE